jgi:pimeloyl-ACP methyl ester carboxylesterase
MDEVREWERRGRRAPVLGRDIFFIDEPADTERAEPVLVLHGFPTCSFDWRHVLGALSATRRAVVPDMLGYGLSDKPLDHAYSLFEEADIVCELMRALGIERCALVTHDVGDSVGGELCARALDGTLPFEITRRVLTNGSVYMDLVQLSVGQQLMLALPDEALPAANAPGAEIVKPALAATFASPPDDDELEAQWRLIARADGNRILPRLIRYVEERRVHERRWTGGIENHPSPATIVWGDADPIAVFAMAERLAGRVRDAKLVRLEGVGHYPMIEAAADVANALADALGS